jgi:hypothetical protein
MDKTCIYLFQKPSTKIANTFGGITHAEMCRNNPLCRHDMYDIEPASTYASVLVGNVWASVQECETQFVPSFCSWCMFCQKLSFVKSNTFIDYAPVGSAIVHGPFTYRETIVRDNSFEAQIVLWRKLRELSLSSFVENV